MIHRKSRFSFARELYYILCIVVLAVFIMFGIAGRGGYLELKKVKGELDEQAARVEALKKENAERIEAIRKLRSDPETQEGVARENGYGREGEIIQQVPQDSRSKTDTPSK